jgi:hypothetical protein
MDFLSWYNERILMDNYVVDFLKIVRDNIKCIIAGDYESGKTDLNDLGNLALLSVERRSVFPSVKGQKKLTIKQKLAIRKFYWPYVRLISTRYHRLYTDRSGRFSPYYIPEDLYLLWIDRYLCGRVESKYWIISVIITDYFPMLSFRKPSS